MCLFYLNYIYINDQQKSCQTDCRNSLPWPAITCHSGVHVRPEALGGAVPRLPEGRQLFLYVEDIFPAGGDDARRLIEAMAPENKK